MCIFWAFLTIFWYFFNSLKAGRRQPKKISVLKFSVQKIWEFRKKYFGPITFPTTEGSHSVGIYILVWHMRTIASNLWQNCNFNTLDPEGRQAEFSWGLELFVRKNLRLCKKYFGSITCLIMQNSKNCKKRIPGLICLDYCAKLGVNKNCMLCFYFWTFCIKSTRSSTFGRHFGIFEGIFAQHELQGASQTIFHWWRRRPRKRDFVCFRACFWRREVFFWERLWPDMIMGVFRCGW